MAHKIEQLYTEWLSLQPLKADDQTRLNQKFMLEFNYNSNHIEGNTLTYGQTELLLLFGKVVEAANMKDLEEMKAHNVGLKMMQTEAMEKEKPLTETFIRQLHLTLLREDYTIFRTLPDGQTTSYIIHAGTYKTRPNSVITVTGERFEYASPEETPALMSDLVAWYNAAEAEGALTPVELAALFHYRYIRIHPFEDGNGRIARLIVNYILSRHNYPMIVVKSKDKENYLTALNRCDVAVGPTPSVGAHAELSQIQPLVSYMEGCLERALTTCIKAAKGESIEEEDDFEKQLAILKRTAKKEVDKNEKQDTPQNKVDIFNLFHRPFAQKLLETLKPATEFFNTFTVHYNMTKNRDSISSGSFFNLNEKVELSIDNLSEKDMGILTEAQSIMFHMAFQGVRAEFNMKDTPIFKQASVLFDYSFYTFNEKSYKYGTFPSEDETTALIDSIKKDVLQRIQNAIQA
ncbi:Fic family protein [Parabacteroides timonensis]|uniref:Fic family protein n=1 Tax=Parabacteroides timonensis TaxID=1871013 RepID=UPI00094ECA40|nr:Fic family protein [Parabacteroides timonensis]